MTLNELWCPHKQSLNCIKYENHSSFTGFQIWPVELKWSVGLLYSLRWAHIPSMTLNHFRVVMFRNQSITHTHRHIHNTRIIIGLIPLPLSRNQKPLWTTINSYAFLMSCYPWTLQHPLFFSNLPRSIDHHWKVVVQWLSDPQSDLSSSFCSLHWRRCPVFQILSSSP